jgi:DNA-binding response OmpR family regulator
MNTSILIIDDDRKLLELLCQYLGNYQFIVHTAETAEKGLALLEKENIDLVVLDIMLPGMDGFETCRRIRAKSLLPVIMLTARGDASDRIVGLELGADDYLPKPFDPRELIARIKAVLRRQDGYDADRDTGNKGIIRKGPFLLDNDRRTVSRDGTEISLTTVEFDMLRIFMQNSGIVLSRDKLLELVRDKDYMPFDRSIDVHVSRLRQKIEVDPKKPVYVKTVWGVGYTFTVK